MQRAIEKEIRKLRSALSDLSWPSVAEYQQDQRNAVRRNQHNLFFRLADVVLRTWYLGLTAFGGPPVHFTILHRMFARNDNKYAPWVDEQTVSWPDIVATVFKR